MLRKIRFAILFLIFSLMIFSAYTSEYSDEKQNFSSAYEAFHETKDFGTLSSALKK